MKTLARARKFALLSAVVCFLTLVPVIQADILYDFNSHYTGTFDPYHFQFTAPDFLTSTTNIPLADITVIQNPANPPGCSVVGAAIINPSSTSFGIETIWSAGCAANTSTATFTDGPAVSDGIHNLQDAITLTIRGTATTTPEPSSLLLLGTGLVAVLRRKVSR